MTGRPEVRVVYTRRGRRWSAAARGFPRRRGEGRTVREAREALRTALEGHLENPWGVDFVEDVRLPGAARASVVRHWRARRTLEAAREAADVATAAAVAALRALRIDLRDAAELLGVSHPKARELMRGEKPRRS